MPRQANVAGLLSQAALIPRIRKPIHDLPCFSSPSFSGKIEASQQEQARSRRQRDRKGEIEDVSTQSFDDRASPPVGTLMSAGAGAQEYPTKPITLIVPWPAGGSTDISMRAIADSASKILGQPIAIDNKAGGGGTVGPATMAAAAKPDGYTIAQLPITVFRLPLMQEVSVGSRQGLQLHHSSHRLHLRRHHQRRVASSRPGRTSSISPRRIPAR